MKKVAYQKEELEELCKNSYTYNEVLVKSGRTKCGNNRDTLKKYIELYDIDISHFTHSTSPVKNFTIIKKNNEKIEIQTQPVSNIKICQQCKKEKNRWDDYYWSGNKTRNICKECVKENERKKYQKRINQINDYKKTLCCKKCGEKRYYLFDFHHRNPKEKDFTIAEHSRAKFETIKNEIEKCDVLCANCHREWHYLSSHNLINSYEEWLNAK